MKFKSKTNIYRKQTYRYGKHTSGYQWAAPCAMTWRETKPGCLLGWGWVPAEVVCREPGSCWSRPLSALPGGKPMCGKASHCPPGSCGGPSTSQRGKDVRQLKLSFFDESVNCYQHFGKLFSIIYHNSKEIQPVHPKGDQSWVFIGRTDAEAETPILWPPHAKS